MANLDTLRSQLAPLLEFAGSLDPTDPAGAATELAGRFPIDGETMTAIRQLVREGVEARWLADRESAGIRFSRVLKAQNDDEMSVDAVHMDKPGPAHTHPNGEFDLCFAVSGEPLFDGNAEGWTVYPPGSWHVPTVTGGVMDILYFLPGGAIRFEAAP